MLTLSICVLALAGCGQDSSSGYPDNQANGSVSNSSESTTGTTTSSTDQTAPKGEFKMPTPKDGEEVAVMETTEGKIVVGFLRDKAPGHVENFTKLANKKFYDGTKFHRVIPGFMIQGGDPNTKGSDSSTWGMGGPGYTIKAEFNDVPHIRGILSMARSQDPDSAGSQFFIMHDKNSGLDGQYTAFGYVISGLETVDKIAKAKTKPGGEGSSPEKPVTLTSVKIVKWPVK